MNHKTARERFLFALFPVYMMRCLLWHAPRLVAELQRYKHICGCGLSNTQPFCNGTHKIAREEDPNKLYWYDEQGKRFETTDSFQGIRCPQE